MYPDSLHCAPPARVAPSFGKIRKYLLLSADFNTDRNLMLAYGTTDVQRAEHPGLPIAGTFLKNRSAIERRGKRDRGLNSIISSEVLGLLFGKRHSHMQFLTSSVSMRTCGSPRRETSRGLNYETVPLSESVVRRIPAHHTVYRSVVYPPRKRCLFNVCCMIYPIKKTLDWIRIARMKQSKKQHLKLCREIPKPSLNLMNRE